MTSVSCLLAALSISAGAFAQDEKAAAPEGDAAAKSAAPEGDAKADKADDTAKGEGDAKGGEAKDDKAKGDDKGKDGEGDDAAADGEDKDNVRFRGGFVVPAVGPAFASGLSGLVVVPIGFDLGVQINHYIGIVYQATPLVTLITNGDSTSAGFVLDNSLLAMLSLGKGVYFDVGAGPSLDLFALGGLTFSTGSVEAGTGVAPGIATRVALGFGGGPSDDSARRAAFKITVDPHFSFLPGAALITIPIGIGVEWF